MFPSSAKSISTVSAAIDAASAGIAATEKPFSTMMNKKSPKFLSAQKEARKPRSNTTPHTP